MLAASLNATLPIFGLILLGFILSSSRILERGAEIAFSNYVFYVALPIEIFLTTLKSSHALGSGTSDYLQAYGAGIFMLWILIFILYKIALKKSTVEIGLNLVAIGQTNTAFLAAPIFILVLGDSKLVMPIIMFQSVVLTTISVLVMESSTFSKSESMISFLKKASTIIIKNPLIISALAGALASQFEPLHHVDADYFIFKIMSLIANTAAPIALMALGISFCAGPAGASLKDDRNEIITGVLVKNLIHPAISFVVGRYFFELTDLMLFALVLISAMPSPKNTFIFAQAYGVPVQKYNLILLTTTATSFFTINVACYFLISHLT